VSEKMRKTSSTTGRRLGIFEEIMPAAGSTAARIPSKNSQEQDRKTVVRVRVCAAPSRALENPFLTAEYMSR